MFKPSRVICRVGNRPSFYKERTREAQEQPGQNVRLIKRNNEWRGRWAGTGMAGSRDKVRPHEYYGGVGESQLDSIDIDKAKAWRDLKSKEIEIIRNNDIHRYASSDPLTRSGKTQAAINWEQLTDEMPIAGTTITDRKSKVLFHLMKLRKDPKYRWKNERFVLRSAEAISKLWQNGYRPEMLLLEPNARVPKGVDLEKVPTVFADKYCVSIASGDSVDGVAAEYFIPEENPKTALWADDGPTIGRAAVLVGITEPDHLGSIIRSAVSLGCDAILLHDCIDPYLDAVLEKSMAAHVTGGGYPTFHILREEEGDDPWGIVNRMIRRHDMLPILSATAQDDIEESSSSDEIWRELHEEDNINASMCFFFGPEKHGLDVDYVKHNVERTCKQAYVATTQVQGIPASAQCAVLLHAFSEPTYQQPAPPMPQRREELAKVRFITPITHEIRAERESGEEAVVPVPVPVPVMKVSKYYKSNNFSTPAYKTRVRMTERS